MKPQSLAAGIADTDAVGAGVWPGGGLEIHIGPTPVLKSVHEVVGVDPEAGLRRSSDSLDDGVRRWRVVTARIGGGNVVCPCGEIRNGRAGGNAADDRVGAKGSGRT